MATALQLITDAWVDSGVGGLSDSLTSTDRDIYLRRMNRMLDSWSAEGLTVYEIYTQTFSTVAGTGTYSSSGFSPTGRPTWISSAIVRSDSVDYPLTIITERESAYIANKSTRGLPSTLYLQPAMSDSAVTLWPVPDAVYTVYLNVPRKFTAYAYTDTVSLPPGFDKAIVDNLAVEIAAAANVTPNPIMLRNAAESKAVIQRRNTQIGVLDTTFGLESYSSDILTDQ